MLLRFTRSWSAKLLAALLVSAGCTTEAWSSSTQGEAPRKQPSGAPKKTALSEEEREILKFRELLENLELLQNLESVKYMDFLSERSAAKAKQKSGKKPAAGEHENKNIR